MGSARKFRLGNVHDVCISYLDVSCCYCRTVKISPFHGVVSNISVTKVMDAGHMYNFAHNPAQRERYSVDPRFEPYMDAAGMLENERFGYDRDFHEVYEKLESVDSHRPLVEYAILLLLAS